ncbi:copper fist DNA binding domain-containing protein [Aspergillus cavernicola]|uniref:Copper fist DNA binding domain-containing protein n=1 Tax=Aspergillus cavernicola TaxID=176166 RepID=A0ABR4HR91_9EURO
MLIDGEKWACEACVRGHRVSTCKHHDRPLIRINRKGRPFSTCSICNCTPCNSPDEHNRLKREAELKSQSQNRASGKHTRSNSSAFLPIAPRPISSSPPPSTTQPQSSRPAYSRGSQSSDAAPDPRARNAAVGGRCAPQGAPHHRTTTHGSNPAARSRSSALRSPPHHQQYASQPGPAHYSGLSSLNMSAGAFSPPLRSMSDMPVSVSMANPFEHLYGDPSLLDGSGGAAAFPSLEDFDLSLQDDMMQEDWRWYADDHA